jgi:taurine dioxygenase
MIRDMVRAFHWDKQLSPTKVRGARVTPLTGALGAEIEGIDLATADDETFIQIRRALTDHMVLIFRDQKMTLEDQKALGRRFGELHSYPWVEGIEGDKHVLEVGSEPTDVYNFGGGWHTDVSSSERPPSMTILRARLLPKVGGDTCFANMSLAYDTLSDGMKQMLSGLRAVHNATTFMSPDTDTAREFLSLHKGTKFRPASTAASNVDHPVVRTHAESRRKSLFLNHEYTKWFLNMTEEESAPLLEYLLDHAVQMDYTCRVRWEVNMVAMWDNRCTMHTAVNDYAGSERRMVRVSVCGERPV